MRSRTRAVILSLVLSAAAALAVGPAASGCVFGSATDCTLTLGFGCPAGASGSSTGSGVGGMGGTSSSTGGTGSGGMTTTTSSTGGSGGMPPECTAVNLQNCADVPPGPCVSLGKKVCVEGKCEVEYTPGDAPSQKYGSCKRRICDDQGMVSDITDDTKLYDDGNPCTQEVCTNGVPSQMDLPGMACTLGAFSGFCVKDPYNAGLVTCSECLPPGTSTCVGGAVCIKGKCVPPHCTSGAKDFGEVDIDCGNSSGCLKCTAASSTCANGSDCPSGVCTSSKCVVASCMDNRQNQDETDVNCGGTTCPDRCEVGLKCILGSDCNTGVCKPSATPGMPNTCQGQTCTDGVKNGDEEDVDCGGTVSACPPCVAQ